ncbi:hypothetical protein [Streptomyces sp. NPDC058672]|uniref:hypothetical protein n=1 Tax=Streptomyces sp. NPDC058672 TaxID=3346591 RepID=UPI0036673F8F
MIDAQRIAALAKLPSPKGTGTDQDNSVEIVRVLSGLHCEPDRAARPVLWSRSLCAVQPLEAGAGGELIAAEDAARVCGFCPIRLDCHTATVAGAPVEVRRWRERADRDGQPPAQ